MFSHARFHLEKLSLWQSIPDLMGSTTDREGDNNAPLPSLSWRLGSSALMGIMGSLTRLFMHGANTQDSHGLDHFLELVDSREDPSRRQNGLITGLCIMELCDDSIH